LLRYERPGVTGVTRCNVQCQIGDGKPYLASIIGGGITVRIVAINGSHRGSKGLNQFLLDKVAAGARQNGAEFETVVLAESKINQCLSCQICRSQKSFLRCVYEDKDDVQKIFNKMRQADLLIFATPVYIFSMSGLMKRLLDRIYSTGDVNDLRISRSGLFFHHIDSELCSKPFVLLVCCDNMENETPRNVLTYFKTYARFMDARIIGTLVRKSGQLMRAMELLSDGSPNPRIQKIYAAFEQAGRELAVVGRISTATQRLANQSVLEIPFLWLLLRIKPLKKHMLTHARAQHKTALESNEKEV